MYPFKKIIVVVSAFALILLIGIFYNSQKNVVFFDSYHNTENSNTSTSVQTAQISIAITSQTLITATPFIESAITFTPTQGTMPVTKVPTMLLPTKTPVFLQKTLIERTANDQNQPLSQNLILLSTGHRSEYGISYNFTPPLTDKYVLVDLETGVYLKLNVSGFFRSWHASGCKLLFTKQAQIFTTDLWGSQIDTYHIKPNEHSIYYLNGEQTRYSNTFDYASYFIFTTDNVDEKYFGTYNQQYPYEIFILDVKTGKQYPLTKNGYNFYLQDHYQWSYYNNLFAYTATDENIVPQLFVWNSKEKTSHQITNLVLKDIPEDWYTDDSYLDDLFGFYWEKDRLIYKHKTNSGVFSMHYWEIDDSGKVTSGVLETELPSLNRRRDYFPLNISYSHNDFRVSITSPSPHDQAIIRVEDNKKLQYYEFSITTQSLGLQDYFWLYAEYPPDGYRGETFCDK